MDRKPSCPSPAARLLRRGLLPLVALALAPPLAAEKVTHHVRLRYQGLTGPEAHWLQPNCERSRRDGFDLYDGDLTGDESELQSEGQIVYRGVVKRTTDIDVCDVGPEDANGVRLQCNIQLVGGGEYDAELTVYEDRSEVYFQVEPRPGTVTVNATTGGCEQSLMIDVAHMYRDDGDGFEHWIGPKVYGPRDRVGGPLRPGHYPEPPPHDPFYAVGSWTMDVGPGDVLHADAGGPYRVRRGQRVRIDGSRSTGPIERYTWTLTPKPCPPCGELILGETPEPVNRDGVRFDTVALCAFEAKLVVSKGPNTSEDTAMVEIVPRPEFKTATPGPVTGEFDPGSYITAPCREAHWGTNVCAIEHAARQPTDFHWIHRVPGASTWERTGFVVGSVSDPDGLWDGWWYVTENKLTMPRAELLHVNLGATTCAAQRNASIALATRAADPFAKLRTAVAAHEHEHTVQLNAQLKAFDPAEAIEAFVAPPDRRAALVEGADRKIRAANTKLWQVAIEDAPVRAALRGRGFRNGGDVLFLEFRADDTPGTCQEASLGSCHFASFAETDDAPIPPPDTADSSSTGCEGAPGGPNAPARGGAPRTPR